MHNKINKIFSSLLTIFLIFSIFIGSLFYPIAQKAEANDTPGITISPTSGLTTTEAGGTATFTVVLNSKPTADVILTLESSDLTEGTITPTNLTFTSSNWNIPQTVTITGVNDSIIDGNVNYTIITHPASSTDPNYNNLDPPDVSVTNIDNDKIIFPQTPTDKFWVTNGPVYTILPATNGITYIGGRFSYVGPYTGSAVPFDLTTNQPKPNYPKVDGYINTIIPDGSNGWYIGGYFTKVGNVSIKNLAHILSDGTVDSNWKPEPNGSVNTLALNGSTLYVGGYISSISGTTRNYLAAIDTTTGQVANWDPEPNYPITALALSSSTLYVGGRFSSISGTTRNYLASFDISSSTPVLTSWDPEPDSNITALALSSSTLYVGGDFTTMNNGSTTRNYLASFDISSSTPVLTSWDPEPDSDIYALALSSSTLYVGGDFTTMNNGSTTRKYLASFDISSSTPVLTSWDPEPNSDINALALSSSTLYVGGYFSSISGKTRKYLASFDISSSAPELTSWDPELSDGVDALALNGSTLYVSGSFTSIGGTTRNYLAAIDTTTGQATSWDPEPDGVVGALALNGSTLYVSGSFTSIGGTSRNYLAAIDTTTGQATSWDPEPNSGITALALNGSTLYVGGFFTTISSTARKYLASFDISSSTPVLTSWDPEPNSNITALALSSSTLYVGGYFSSISGTTRNYLAAIDTTTGQATSWDPEPNSGITALALNGSTLYVGGFFSSISGTSRNHLAAIDTTTGQATSWDPEPDGFVGALAPYGSTLYVGGSFTSIGGTSRNYLAAIDTTTGQAISWDPEPDGWEVYTLALNGSTLYVGGYFTSIGGTPRYYLAVFSGNQNSDLPIIQFTVSSSSDNESVTSKNIELSLSQSVNTDVTVNYSVTGGTATANEDYILNNGTATIPAGSTTTTIPLTIINDNLKELNETIVITLSKPTNASLGQNNTFTYTILDDDNNTSNSTTTQQSVSSPVTGINASSQVSNLISIGNYQYAYQLMKEFPHLFTQKDWDLINEKLGKTNQTTTTTTTIPGKALKPATYQFTNTLQIGMQGPSVIELQKRLKEERLYNGPITGYFGPLTEAAVKSYQKKYGINPTGIVGPITRDRLNSSQNQTSNTITNLEIQAKITELQQQLAVALTQLVQLLQAKLNSLQTR